MSKRIRNTNLELFRIITMITIISHHYVVNSGIMNTMLIHPLIKKSLFFFFVGAWGKTGINCFVILSGYFMCKSKISMKKFIKLLFEIEFYRIIIYLIFCLFKYEKLTLLSLFYTVIPVKSIGDGFTSAYIVFFLFIPFLNILLNGLNEKMHLRLILLCLFMYTFLSSIPIFSITMNYVSWFMVIYIIAAYIRLYPKPLFNNKKIFGITSIVCIIISLLSIVLCLKKNMFYYFFVSDSNKVMALITSFSLFLFFKNINIKYNKYINMIASTSFGVLLIHANSDAMRRWLWQDILKNTVFFDTKWWYIHFLVSICIVYIVCVVIDLLRQRFIEKYFFKLYDKYINILYSKFSTLEMKILIKFQISDN